MITPLQHHEMKAVRRRLAQLYPAEAERCVERFATLAGRYGVGLPAPAEAYRWSERDAVLITYAHAVRAPGEPPLRTLRRFLEERVGDAVNTVHVLPFFPSSSDDGFSVVHFRTVDPALGDWTLIQELAGRYRLMVDLVLNHASRQSGWFKDFETGVAPGRHYFITPPPGADLTAVVRPRTHPLLTAVATRSGCREVWTTFSADQIDLNYAQPDVLFEMLDILLFYIAMGARVIRLDAVAYLWKKVGTTSVHLLETHEVVRLMRELLHMVAPDVLLVTETNVPHAENVSYFGDGGEAHLVYNFSLPPLVLHALVNGHAHCLTEWAARLAPPPAGCSFLNFTASHDGIGVRPLEGLVPEGDLARLVSHVRERGGDVSFKQNADGSQSPYELNIAWFSALQGGAGEPLEVQLQRFLCSQAIALALRGVPAVYFHSLVATPNYPEGVAETGRARSINRRSWLDAELRAALDTEGSAARRVLQAYVALLRARARHPAFHPDADQKVLSLEDRVLAVERIGLDGSRVLTLSNCSSAVVTLKLDAAWKGICRDLAGGRDVTGPAVTLQPYQFVWLCR